MLARLADYIHLLQYAHLLWGFGLFVGLAVWAYWPARRHRMHLYASQILSDDTLSERDRHVE